jgi:membrane-associated phospholipid phosphatase
MADTVGRLDARRNGRGAAPLAWLVVALGVGAGAPVGAQAAAGAATDSVGPHPALFTPATAVTGGAFLVTAAAIAPFDRRITDRLRADWLQRNQSLRNTADALDVGFGSPGAFVIAGGLFAGAWLARDRPLASTGIDMGEAVVSSAVVAEAVKWLTGRARPSQRPEDPWDWGFGRGFAHDGDASFPSAETTLAFALASAASVDAARAWPRLRVFLPVAFYTTAATVGLGRVYRNDHWASDVVVGAGVGTLAGLLATRFNLFHQDNFIRRWLLPPS